MYVTPPAALVSCAKHWCTIVRSWWLFTLAQARRIRLATYRWGQGAHRLRVRRLTRAPQRKLGWLSSQDHTSP